MSLLNRINSVLLTSGSGTFKVSPGVSNLQGQMTGGGGGGGGVAAAAATAAGGMPGILIGFEMFVTPGQLLSYSVGALGLGGVAGNNNGIAGGDTTFGPFVAKGGLGGTGSASGNAASTGLQVPAIAALINLCTFIPTVNTFMRSMSVLGATAGAGNGVGGLGTGFWGVGGASAANSAGGNATGYGASGAGAGQTTTPALAGGNGSGGAILLWWNQ